MENQYHHVDNTARTRRASPAYRSLEQQFLITEYRRFSPRIRGIVDAIRRSGRIPLFRAVGGDWVDPRQQILYSDFSAFEAMRTRLRGAGMPEDEINRTLRRTFRSEGVSTSLSLTAGLEVVLAKRQYQGRRNVQITILAWDGISGEVEPGHGFYGADPMEIYVNPLSVEVSDVVEVSPRIIQYFENNLEHSSDRNRVWPALLNHVENVDAH